MCEKAPHEVRHRPRSIHMEGADTAVVCIHGILGSPDHFAFLEESVHAAGCAFFSLLLPGHGGSGDDFAHANVQAWKAFVLQTLEALQARYARLLLVGHSMGGLLSLHAARAMPGQIYGLFLLALPLRLRPSLENMKTVLSAVFGKENSPRRLAMQASQSVAAPALLGYLRWLPNLYRLLPFSREARRSLPSIKQQAWLLLCAKDEIVSPRTAQDARRGLARCRVTLLSRSSHYRYSFSDQEEILTQFQAFLQA